MIYYGAACLLYETAAACVCLLYFALTPELSPDYDERTSLTAYRMTLSILGGLTASPCPGPSWAPFAPRTPSACGSTVCCSAPSAAWPFRSPLAAPESFDTPAAPAPSVRAARHTSRRATYVMGIGFRAVAPIALVVLARKSATGLASWSSSWRSSGPGYVANAATQSPDTLNAIRGMTGPPPALLLSGGIGFAMLYPIGRETHREVREKLARRRAAVGG